MYVAHHVTQVTIFALSWLVAVLQCVRLGGLLVTADDNKPFIPGYVARVWGRKFKTRDGNWGSWMECKK